MAIPIFSEIERLITEHGSAVILKERIAQLREQMEILEKKNSASALREGQLDSENQALRLNLEKAEIEINNLEKATDLVHSGRLEEIREKILVLLSKQQDTKETAIYQALGLSEQIAKFHITYLVEAKLIRLTTVLSMSMSGRPQPHTYGLSQEGRRYLVTHGLLA